MGTKITKVTSLEGVSAETAGAITLFITDHFRYSCFYNTYDYRFYHWGWTYEKSFCRKMGNYSKLTLGMGITIPISAIVAGITYLL
jgi:PiT family inorganic phosphate transporter